MRWKKRSGFWAYNDPSDSSRCRYFFASGLTLSLTDAIPYPFERGSPKSTTLDWKGDLAPLSNSCYPPDQLTTSLRTPSGFTPEISRHSLSANEHHPRDYFLRVTREAAISSARTFLTRMPGDHPGRSLWIQYVCHPR